MVSEKKWHDEIYVIQNNATVMLNKCNFSSVALCSIIETAATRSLLKQLPHETTKIVLKRNVELL